MTMITPSYLGETIEYSSLHACRSTLEDPTTYFHQENYDAALREYLRVEILYPYPRWQAAAVLQAGKCEELLGRKKEAAEMYARLIKAYPNTEFTEEGKQRLHALEAATTGASRAVPPR